MNDTMPKMHVCKNCGFMSTQGDLFAMVEGLLLCLFCIEGYADLYPGRSRIELSRS